jgi:hypothetical protein
MLPSDVPSRIARERVPTAHPLPIVLELELVLVLVIEVFSACGAQSSLSRSLGAAHAHRRPGNIDYEDEFEFEYDWKKGHRLRLPSTQSQTPPLAVDPHQGIQKILGTDNPRRIAFCVHNGRQAVR